MGVLGALFSGVSGLDVYSQAIEVIGNNIANANSPGFKGSRAEFADILARSLTGSAGGNQIGRGVQLAGVTQVFTQGSFETTSNGTDLAIDGRGFFIVRNPDGVFYTRAGLFSIDSEGFLVNGRGDKVQGVTLDSAGNPSGTQQDLNLTVTNNPPQKTTTASFVANLDARESAIGSAGTATSAAVVTDRFQFVTGQNNILVVDFAGAGANTQVDLTGAGGLTSGAVNTGAQVATAIAARLNAQAPTGETFTASYNPTTRKFEITQTATGGGLVTLDHVNTLSNASDDLGFSKASNDTFTALNTAIAGDNQVEFNVVNTRNTFTITLDGGFYGVTNRTVTVAAGGYTGDQLAQAIEVGINGADNSATVNRMRAVRVTYNAAGNANKFQIVSQTTGEARTISIPSNSTTFTIPPSAVVVGETAIGVLEVADMSLNAAADAVLANGVGKFSPTDPSNLQSSNFSTSIILFDSLGSSHSLNVFFRKIGENIWEYNGIMLGRDLVGPTATTSNEQVLYGRLWFNEDGSLDVEDKFDGAQTLDSITFTKANIFNFSGGATQGQAINFDFGTAKTTDANPNAGLDGVTQFAGASAVINQIQNGFTTGTLISVSVNRNGNITGQFTNGQTRDLARITLANFNAPAGLSNVGNSLFAETQGSGQPILGQATTAGFGVVLANSVEISNVDIAEEFVRLIRDQQAFQANARVISTTSRLLDEVVNLTR